MTAQSFAPACPGLGSESSLGSTLNVSGRAAAAAATGPVMSLNDFGMDWSPGARDALHIWSDAEGKDHLCYVCGDGRSSSKGGRQKCMACKIAVHQLCMAELLISGVDCKHMFSVTAREESEQDGREQYHRHHWVKQRKPVGRCPVCQKHIITKFLKSSKDFHAIGCAWCKELYHVHCYYSDPGIGRGECTMGEFRLAIVPPEWIIRKTRSRHPARRGDRAAKPKKALHGQFIVKQTADPVMHKPLLVFVNPKSGGNQGAKVLSKLLWLLNPRQVFNLLIEGPEFALRLYGKVSRLRILVCGGDGTVGWVLQAIDKLGLKPSPPIAVLPIGTGNDLARTLGWGGKYNDEGLGRILHRLSSAAVVRLDRWALECSPGAPAPGILNADGEDIQAEAKPPLSVFNNYFSIGADALVALEFHESREANPERFNSRWYNKMFYAGAGGKEILERKSRDFIKYVGVLADGVDLTPMIRQEKLAAIVFLNISHYSAGTRPWGTGDSEYGEARLDDGLIEVIGLNSMSMAALHLGRPGVRITQAREITIITSRALPVQVDGEPCRLGASTLIIQRKNQANMLARIKTSGQETSSASQSIAHLGELVQPVPFGNPLRERCSSVEEGALSSVPATLLDEEELAPQVEAGFHSAEGVTKIVALCQLADSKVKGASGGGGDDAELSSDDGEDEDDFAYYDPAGNGGADGSRESIIRMASKAPVYGLGWCADGIASNKSETNMGLKGVGSVKVTNSDSRIVPSRNFSMPPIPNSPSAAAVARPTSTWCTPDASTTPCASSLSSPLPSPLPSPLRRSPATHRRLRRTSLERLSKSRPTSRTSSLGTSLPAVPFLWCEEPLTATDQIDVDHSLVNACKQGNLDVVVCLRDMGASLTTVDSQGLMPLHHAVRHNRLNVVTYLLDNIPRSVLACVDTNKRQTALHKAAWYGYLDIAQALVEAGLPLLPQDYEGLTAYQRSLASTNTALQTYLRDMEQLHGSTQIEVSTL